MAALEQSQMDPERVPRSSEGLGSGTLPFHTVLTSINIKGLSLSHSNHRSQDVHLSYRMSFVKKYTWGKKRKKGKVSLYALLGGNCRGVGVGKRFQIQWQTPTMIVDYDLTLEAFLFPTYTNKLEKSKLY